jgi:hypothetical protein
MTNVNGILNLMVGEDGGIVGIGSRYSNYTIKLQIAPPQGSKPTSGTTTALPSTGNLAVTQPAPTDAPATGQPTPGQDLRTRLEERYRADAVLKGYYLDEPNGADLFELKNIRISRDGAFAAELYESDAAFSVVGRVTDSSLGYKGDKWIKSKANAAIEPNQASYQLVFDAAGKLAGTVKYSPSLLARVLLAGKKLEGPIDIRL